MIFSTPPSFGVVDRDRARLLGERQAVLVRVDDEHLARSLEHRRHRRHQAHRPAP
jgi:hypothetical protein